MIISNNNCYCSCEKVFRPDLEGKPIVVLSNNDGCVVARSNEAKKMGIKEGTPYFQLAKIASKLAKKYATYKHCCMIDTDYKREKALEWCPIEDVWGIGRRYAAKLQALGCKTALDFAKHHKDWVRLTFNNINIVRTWQELNGEDAVPNEELAKKKSICTSRSFNGMISDKDTLRTHIANYAARCAEKLRAQKTVATTVGVFVNTNAFREDLAQYWNFQETRLVTPTSSTIPIVQAAHDVLDRIFIQGYQYKKAGVIVMGITPDSPIQQDLFDLNAEQIQKMRRLDEVIDRINRMHGSETIVIGAQQYTQKNGKGKAEVFANAIKHDFRSKNPTTRWSDIIKLK